MRRRNRLLTGVIALLGTVSFSFLAATPASADVGVINCDDGGGGIEGHTNSSQCASYHNFYLTHYVGCATSISDEPVGKIDTITVNCAWGWVSLPNEAWVHPYTLTPANDPDDPNGCRYGATPVAGASCGDDADPLDNPNNRQNLIDWLNGSIVAGPGGALGEQGNPIPLDAGKYKPPPNRPHVWRSKTLDEAGQTAILGCVVVGGTGAIIGTTFQPGLGTGVGALAGCAGGVAGSYAGLLYKSHVHIWYPVVNGEASRNPADWYVCTDHIIVPASGGSVNPFNRMHFRYPDNYPDLGGTVQPFARNCTPGPI